MSNVSRTSISRALLTTCVLACLCPGLQASSPGAWIDVPFVKQQTDGCGAAAISMVMQYWDQHQGGAAQRRSDASLIQQSLYSREAHGISASDMERYFRDNGYQEYSFHGDLNDIRQHLQKGRPLIAALKPGAGAPLHYVVIVGIDDADHTVLLNDPAERKLMKRDAQEFERQWKATSSWTLLAVPSPPAP